MKSLFLILIIASVSFYFFSQIPREKQNEIINPKTISFSFVGDLMCHSPQFESARVSADSFDFRPVYSEVKEILSKSDFTIGNLETVIGGKELRYTGYPMFNTPIEYLHALKDAGFDILATANNHSLDRGVKGIFNTIDNLRKYDLQMFGSFKTSADRDSILIIEKNDIRAALLAYTYGLNGNVLPKEKSFMVNLIDTSLIIKDIQKAKMQNADVVIIYFHFGDEYERHPNNYQKEVTSKVLEYGADIIIGSHPHVIQPLEFLENKKSKLDQSFIAYSLGNFFSNQRWRYSDCGVVLNFTLEKYEKKIILDTLSITPVWVSKELKNGKIQYKILPSDTSAYKAYSSLAKAEQSKLIRSFRDTKEIMKSVESFKRKTSHRIN